MKLRFPPRAELFRLTRDERVLWKIVIAILVICTLIAWAQTLFVRDPGVHGALRMLKRMDSAPPDGMVGYLVEFTEPALTFEVMAREFDSTQALEPKDLKPSLERNPKLSAENREVLAVVWGSFVAGKATPELQRLAALPTPPRFVNEGLAVLVEKEDPKQAMELLIREGKAFSDAHSARAAAVNLAIEQNLTEETLELLNNPTFAGAVSSTEALKFAADRKDWVLMVKIVVSRDFSQVTGSALGLFFLTGGIWFLIALHMARAFEAPIRLALCVAALLLGYLSSIPVLILDFLQGYWHGMTLKGELINDLIYYVLGVGVREETLKLLFFLPLTPFLLMRRNAMEMLMVAAIAGLGFAIAENLNYIEAGGVMAALARFLTANFFHLAATGIAGYALCQALLDMRRGMEFFLTQFILVILIHGAYNTLLSGALGQEGCFFATALLIALGYMFFRQLHHCRDVGREPISLLATFCVGSALVIGIAIIVSVGQLGFEQGLSLAGIAALNYAVLNVLFVRELGRL